MSENLLQARLDEPRVAEALARMLDRIESLERAVNGLTDAFEQIPGLVGTITDSADAAYRQATESGIDLEAQAHAGLVLAARLTEPDTAARLTQLIALLDDGPGLAAMAGDAFDEGCRHALASGIDPARLGSAARRTARALCHCEQDAPPPLGVMGLLGATRDPDVQRGLGYLVSLARQLGAQANDEGGAA